MSAAYIASLALLIASTGQTNPEFAPVVSRAQWEQQSQSGQRVAQSRKRSVKAVTFSYEGGNVSSVSQAPPAYFDESSTVHQAAPVYVHPVDAEPQPATVVVGGGFSPPAVSAEPCPCQESRQDSCFSRHCGCETGCQCGGGYCSGHCSHTRWLHLGLPSTWYAPGDLTPHMPCDTYLRGYYYFRPYNYTHIYELQADVQVYGEDPRNPYDNRFFGTVYGDFAEQEKLEYELARAANSLPEAIPVEPSPSDGPASPEFPPLPPIPEIPPGAPKNSPFEDEAVPPAVPADAQPAPNAGGKVNFGQKLKWRTAEIQGPTNARK